MKVESPNNALQDELHLIIEKLLATAQPDDEGIFWSTLGLNQQGQIVRNTTESIYCGVGGIALFFIRLYEFKGERDYLSVARKALAWCAARVRAKQPHTDAFVTGWLGLAWVFAQMYRHEPEKKYLDLIRDIVENTPVSDDPSYEVDDYINGLAGKVHALMFIYEYIQEDWVLTKLDAMASQLVQKAWITNKGAYWDRGGQQVCGLCGFSHGASGIAYTFLELARFTRNDHWLFMADQAFLYEDKHYKASINNWPDFRRGAYTDLEKKAFKEQYEAGNKEYFELSNDMNAWCHGASGIGLARLRAYQQLGDPKHLRIAKKAIKKTIETDINAAERRFNFTLCHGGGGNAELFLLAYEILGDKKYLSYAHRVGEASIADRIRKGHIASGYNQSKDDEDPSLFMGMAGNAYFLMRSFSPAKIPSILAPRISFCLEKKRPTPLSIKHTLLTKYFPKTAKALPKREVDKLGLDLMADFHKLVLHHGTLKPELLKVYKFEKALADFDLSARSHSWLFMKRSNPPTETNYPNTQSWRLDSDAQIREIKDRYILALRGPNGVVQHELSGFIYSLLKAYGNGRTHEQVTQSLLAQFDVNSPEEEVELRGIIVEQIQESVKAGVLERV